MQVVGGRYDLIRQVGAGGMGQVFEGFDRNLKRRVAVKVAHANLESDPEWTRRFRREAELMATVSHPGTPAIYDAGVTDTEPYRPYLVMEFVDGRNLDDVLARRGPLPIGIVAAIGAQTAAVLGGYAPAPHISPRPQAVQPDAVRQRNAQSAGLGPGDRPRRRP
ncbi:protein kinase domain-containing protein [Nocardia abscessus]|uniref:protein kinase domain-containing protein n=1 Tax=Nocardia abscessus TaxID=120957 RepID=UPI002453B9A8|nr:protein kinase [Nocardia abscessus]